MQISEGLQLDGKVVEIPDCDRNDLPEFFVSQGFKVGVEVGVYKADYLKRLAAVGLQMYGVDPWKAYDDYSRDTHIRPDFARFQDRQDFLYEHSQRVVAEFPNVVLIRKTSMEALADFPDESIDFVYIDGHHGFKYVAEDIWEWTKKVRRGGVISGHDYALNGKDMRDPYVMHVKYVVDAYVKAIGIQKLYILGRKESVPGEKRDKTRSWLWFNN